MAPSANSEKNKKTTTRTRTVNRTVNRHGEQRSKKDGTTHHPDNGVGETETENPFDLPPDSNQLFISTKLSLTRVMPPQRPVMTTPAAGPKKKAKGTARKRGGNPFAHPPDADQMRLYWDLTIMTEKDLKGTIILNSDILFGLGLDMIDKTQPPSATLALTI